MENLVLEVFFFKVLILENQKLPLASGLFVLDWSFAVTPIGQAEVQWLFILPDGPALISSPGASMQYTLHLSQSCFYER